MDQKARQAKNNRRDIVAVAGFLVLVLAVWIGIASLPKPTVSYVEGNGIFDLSNADFENVVFIPSGRWLSYPERLYTPEDLAGPAAISLPVPSDTIDYTTIQFATHTMELKLPAGIMYGIFLRSPDYSMRLYINGAMVDQVGVPGESREASTPRVLERTYSFMPETDTTTIVIQTSNFVHRIGASPPIIFVVGEYLTIQRHTETVNIITMFMVGCLMAAALFHLGIFTLNRKRKTSLIFAFSCLFAMLLPGNAIQFFPDYDWQILFRGIYISHYALIVLIFWFLDKLHPQLFHKTVIRGYFIFAGVYTALTLILDTTVFTRMVVGFQTVSILVGGYIFVMLLRNLRNPKIQNILSFAGLAVVVLFGINDIFLRINIVFFGVIGGQLHTVIIGVIFLVFCYTLALSLDYAETERTAAEASEREKAFAAENAALESLSRMKSEYLANISHETKTPLAIISVNVQMAADLFETANSAYAELLTHADEGTTRQLTEDSKIITEALERAQEAVLRVGRMADNNLWLASNQENREKMSVIEISKLLVSSTEIRRRVIEKEGNKLILNIPDDFNVQIYGNAGSLSQVIDNLLANARNHTASGEISVRAECEGDFVVVSVSDTGVGIDPSILPRIFERGITSSGGTGIGLAICKSIIESHGGEIWLESEQGKGTTATFKVPIFNESEEANA